MFVRGAGIILPPNYPGADLLIPVKIFDSKMNPRIGCILIQVKNWRCISQARLQDNVREALNRAVLELQGVDCLTMIMSLQRQDGGCSCEIYPPQLERTTRYSEQQLPTIITTGFNADLFPSICRGENERSMIYETVDKLLKWRRMPAHEDRDEVTKSYLQQLLTVKMTADGLTETPS
ncbi:hypothetical protein KEM54_004374 [Ascosphaera aggregata]|nr:hypothetical protein KEM54_004374 [Ascosphaera aggregata]